MLYQVVSSDYKTSRKEPYNLFRVEGGHTLFYLAFDGGRNTSKLCTSKGLRKFPSLIGEWIDLSGYREVSNGPFDFEVEFRGEKYFAGTLAKYESDFATTMHTERKDNIETLILCLLSLFISTDERMVKIITSQPIKVHTEENKKKIKDLMMGEHEITVNGITKRFLILDCLVACESGVAAYSLPELPPTLRILDFGSSTVNGASLLDGRFVRNQSDTLPFGMETNTNTNVERMARRVISQFARKWKSEDPVLVIGGAGEIFLPHVVQEFPNAVLHNKPQYANVLGLWEVGRSIWHV